MSFFKSLISAQSFWALMISALLLFVIEFFLTLSLSLLESAVIRGFILSGLFILLSFKLWSDKQ
jgi:hypothetical protein